MALDTGNKRYYDILGLKPDASHEAVRLAYKKLALQWHPDRHQDDKEHAQQKFVEVKEAYQHLLQTSSNTYVKKAQRSTTKPTRAQRESNPISAQNLHTRIPHTERQLKANGKLHAPKASISTSSSSQSSTEATRFQQHMSYVKVERDGLSGQDPLNQGGHKYAVKPSDLDGEGFETVNVADLASPLQPLRIPQSNLAKDWIFPLPLTLEDLCHGATHHYRITRILRSGASQVIKIDIKVLPNWRTDTRIRIANVGNQRRDGSYQDIVFIVKEVPHPRFTRIGDDLYLTVHVPWPDTHTAPHTTVSDGSRITYKRILTEICVQSLDGQEFSLRIPRSPEDGTKESRVVGGGLPVQKNDKHVGKGDLCVKWVFTPADPSKLQNTTWRSLRKVMVWRT